MHVVRKTLLRGGLILGSLLVALLLTEVGLRLGGWGTKVSRYFDPDIGMRFHGNQTRQTFGRDGPKVPYTVNQEGLRGRWYDGPKPAGVTRILCLGDSFTFAWGVKDEDAYPLVLERLLEARLGPGRAQVANFGFPMLNTQAERGAYAKLARGKQWDAMLLGWYPNDVEPTAGGVRYIDHWIFHALSGTALMEFFHYRIRRHISLFDVERSPELLASVQRYQENFVEIESNPDGELGRPYWESGMAELRALIADVRRDELRTAVILFPTSMQVTALREALQRSPAEADAAQAGPLGAPQRRVRAELEALDVPVIDLLRPLAELAADPFGGVDTGHLNEQGYRLTAERALAKLDELGWLSAPD